MFQDGRDILVKEVAAGFLIVASPVFFPVSVQGFVPTTRALFARFQSGLSDLGWVT